MIIDMIVILKLYLIFVFNRWVSVFGTRVRIMSPCIIIWTPYIPLDIKFKRS